jgi:iron complex outermembrane receptor protein
MHAASRPQRPRRVPIRSARDQIFGSCWSPTEACGRGAALHRLARFAGVAGLLLACAAASADERLPEVVVTAPALRDETPAPRDPTAFATVIETREAATSVETLTDVLSDTVGVQVRRFGGLGDFSTVSVRGFSPGQVQVYLDGVPLSRADNEVVNLSDLPLDAIDHVEVYRGVTPLVFAQSGPGGVVNVVTRRPGAEPFAAGSASYGSFETRKADLAAGGSHGAVDALVFAQYLGSKGDFRFTNEMSTPQTSDDVRETRVNNAFNQGDVTARLVYRAAPLTLAFTSETFAKSQGVPGRDTVQSTTGHRDTERQLTHLDLATAPRGPWSIGLDGSLFGLFQREVFTADGEPDRGFPKTDATNLSSTVGGQLVGRGAIGRYQVPGVLVASSVERFVESNGVGSSAVSPGTAPPRTRTRLTLAGEDELVLLDDRLSIVPNLRWEFFHDVFPGDPLVKVPSEQVSGSHTQDFFTPRLGIRADVGWDVTVLGNVGRSARVPNLSELFGNNGVVAGNQHLKPETATSWDLGFRARSPWTNAVVTDATLESAYFWSDVDDVIVLVPSSVNVFTPKNIAAATIRGEEVALRMSVMDRFLVTANFTHQDARDATAGSNYDGNRLPNRPANEAYARLELTWSPGRPLPLGAFGRRLWPGRAYYDIDFIADNFLNRANTERVGSRAYNGLGLDLTLPWAGLHVAWELKNFTNDQTVDALGFPLPGRSMFVTVSYGFGTKAPAAGGAAEK